MTTVQQIQQEVATLFDEESREKVLHFIRFLKWEHGDYLDDPRLTEQEKQDGLSYEWRQTLLAEKQHTQATGELYSFEDVFQTVQP